ncbi:hypothetical protein BCV72DRAFT_284297 [Rhizopus microsporus var. microsporus]|uniref:HAD-like protein n=2 Tax=Rhizopus microsporus TaxID=58291 RepID=A0A2G4STM2_RHIZD|nr:uncharacterized protein RHIMIDRAFT_292239 [Rhizopus microsporus ATCC 52813]ORE11612.1 hypothetical protein BCV72DRAFT_284297 [Rhizopus microsporus var. microsporus]PHZ12095.1 hypothetical protein RHIMIDRAFT_292239 [Rhizopus microsporus ATCC 52813]
MPTREARKLIAVDLDQTLCQTLDSLVEWHNDTYCTNFGVTDFHTLDYWKVWGGTREETYRKIREFYDSSYFDRIKPVKDFALEALKMLKKRHFQLVIITSRQQFIAEKTKKFIDRHYPGIFESIYFCNLYLTEREKLEYISKSKSLICQEIGVDVLIDDSLEHALDCTRLNMNILLYDRQGKYTWNHHDLPPRINRVFNWKQVMAQFPKPSSPLKHCIYSFDDYNIYFNQQYRHTYFQYETIEVEEESDDEPHGDENELSYHFIRDNSVYV